MIFTFYLRGTLPRLRIDQLMGLCWKVLIPLSLLNLIVAATFVVYGWVPTIPLAIVVLAGAYWFYRREWLKVIELPERPPVRKPVPSRLLAETADPA
jgi:NADH-quinone oxidoreductase subunit H